MKLKLGKINRKMVPVKAFGTFLNMGVNTIFPYVALQMVNIGLSLEDISFVYGAIPLFTFIASPIAGQHSFSGPVNKKFDIFFSVSNLTQFCS